MITEHTVYNNSVSPVKRSWAKKNWATTTTATATENTTATQIVYNDRFNDNGNNNEWN